MKKKTNPTNQELSRRSFLGSSAVALAGVGLTGRAKLLGADASAQDEETKIKEYRTLGRTGFKVSDMAFGSGELAEPALLEAILDAGINYIDTAEGYGRGRTERIIGSVIKNRDRKKIFVTTKLGLRGDLTKEAIKGRALKCLERLQTEYVDCLMIHMPSTVEQLNTEGFHAAFEELKTEGRVRFRGLSNHGAQWGDVPETMEKVHLAAAEDGRFDVALLVYNFLQKDEGERILKAYKQKDIGATLMKTNPVLNYMEVKEQADQLKEEGKEVSERMQNLLDRLKGRADATEAFQKQYGLKSYDEVRSAAIKFVLNNPNVSCACPTIKNFSDLEFYGNLSGASFDIKAEKTLAAYKALYGDLYCRHACGKCESNCPHAVPVNTIMRYNHYFQAQGREKTAMVKYAALPQSKADKCRNCSGYCERSCPYGVPIQGLLMLADNTLTLT
ncbi:MAG: aldo/keto reductase [Candidatus Aminicenantaceae bacterium]